MWGQMITFASSELLSASLPDLTAYAGSCFHSTQVGVNAPEQPVKQVEPPEPAGEHRVYPRQLGVPLLFF